MENKQEAVEWLVERLPLSTTSHGQFIIMISQSAYYDIVMKAKEIEKENKRQNLIDLLDWMNKVAADNPMAFETDHDDIVDMYLNGYYK